MISIRRFRLPLLAAVLAAGTIALLAGCGGDDNGCGGEHAGHDEQAQGEGSERACLSAMVPHHRSAIEMAEIAQQRAEAPEIERLADAIVSAQQSEIAQMGRIHDRLFGTALKPDEGAHDQLGLSAEEAGMDHSEADMRELRSVDPFDRAFVDMKVPHYVGADRMARADLYVAEVREILTWAVKV